MVDPTIGWDIERMREEEMAERARVCWCGLCTWCGRAAVGEIERTDPDIMWRSCLCTPTWQDAKNKPHPRCLKAPGGGHA